MGYYTKYSLEIKDSNSNDIYEHLLLVDEDARYALQGQECKWYNHESDIKSFSKMYPDTIFILEGYGEEDGDIWRKYFKNGKLQVVKAKIVFDDFNEEKLI